MEVLLGIRGKDYVLLGASKAAMRGISILKAEDDKTRQLNEHTLMAFTGEAGDTIQFAEYIQANSALYTMRHDVDLSPKSVASFVRSELARSLRSRNPYYVNMMIAGYDTNPPKPATPNTSHTTANVKSSEEMEVEKEKKEGEEEEGAEEEEGRPHLFWLDYLASQVEVPYGAVGYAQYYCLSIMDAHYKKGMSIDEGLQLMKDCHEELVRRMPIDFKGLNVKVVDKTGIRQVELPK